MNKRYKQLILGMLSIWLLGFGCSRVVDEHSMLNKQHVKKELQKEEKFIEAENKERKAAANKQQGWDVDSASRKEVSSHLARVQELLAEFQKKENNKLLEQALEEIMTASGYDPDSTEVKQTLQKVENMTAAFEKQALHDYGAAIKFARQEHWENARQIFQSLEGRYPGYRDVEKNWLKKCNEGMHYKEIMDEAETLAEKKDWEKALEKLHETSGLPPESQLSKERLANMKQHILVERRRNNLNGAQRAMDKKEWGKAIEKYAEVLKDDPMQPQALEGVKRAKMKLAVDVAGESAALMEKGKYSQAMAAAKRALDLAPDFSEMKAKLKRMSELAAAQHYNNAKKFIKKKLWGNALVESHRAESLASEYKESRKLAQQAEENLRESATIKLAIVTFVNLTEQKGLEELLGASLASAFSEQSGGWVKVYSKNVQRPEGFSEVEMARAIRKDIGAQVCLLGEIRSYHVDQKRTFETARKKYVVSRVVRRNLNYDKATVQALVNNTPFNPHGALPDRVVKVFDEYKYPVYHIERFAKMEIRAFVVDTDTGFVSGKFGKEQSVQVQDYMVEAYPPAGVEPDPLDLPSDTLLLRQVFDKTVQEIVKKTPLISDLHQYYVDLGKRYEEKGEIDRAVEKYMQAHIVDPGRNIMDHIFSLKKYN